MAILKTIIDERTELEVVNAYNYIDWNSIRCSPEKNKLLFTLKTCLSKNKKEKVIAEQYFCKAPILPCTDILNGLYLAIASEFGGVSDEI